jgi:hypothetical protein
MKTIDQLKSGDTVWVANPITLEVCNTTVVEDVSFIEGAKLYCLIVKNPEHWVTKVFQWDNPEYSLEFGVNPTMTVNQDVFSYSDVNLLIKTPIYVSTIYEDIIKVILDEAGHILSGKVADVENYTTKIFALQAKYTAKTPVIFTYRKLPPVIDGYFGDFPSWGRQLANEETIEPGDLYWKGETQSWVEVGTKGKHQGTLVGNSDPRNIFFRRNLNNG